jgi:hypothetical protein
MRLWAAILPLAAVASGCVAVVRAPEDPEDPIAVYLLSRAKHRGILLPAEDGTREHIEYGYGEWGWYARDRTSWYFAFDALFWPTRGTLGRRRVSGEGREDLERGLAARLDPLLVSRGRVRALLAELDGIFREGGAMEEGEVLNPTQGMTFVRHPRRFWLFNNCNDATAEWLLALDCRVSWAIVRFGLRAADD